MRTMKTIGQMSVSVGKTPKERGATQCTKRVNIIASTGQRFLLSKTSISERGQDRRAVSGRTWSEARAPAPPPSDKPGATPPGDAYAPLDGARRTGASCTTAIGRPLGSRHLRHQTGPRAICTTPTTNYTTTTDRCRKSTTFDSLKRRQTEFTIAKLWRQPRFRR